jgi:hypothetical protein
MRRISSLFFLFLFSFSAIASESAAEKAADFCTNRSPKSLGSTIEKATLDPRMRLPFENEGGLLGGGVCWWHSRFQRAVWYLGVFDAGLPRPTHSEARKLIRKLVSRTAVVTIPGYRDLADFSRDFQREIQSELDAWQLRDSFINQAYVRGISGRAHYGKVGRLKRRLDRVYSQYVAAKKKGDLLWIMLQMRGIGSHSSLLHAMEARADGGYHLEVVDSNFPEEMVVYEVRPDDLEMMPANVDVGSYYASVPFVGYSRDLGRIHRAIRRYCAD